MKKNYFSILSISTSLIAVVAVASIKSGISAMILIVIAFIAALVGLITGIIALKRYSIFQSVSLISTVLASLILIYIICALFVIDRIH